MVSSGERLGGREGLGFRTGLASGQAVVKHPEQAVEQVAPHSGIAVTGVLAPLVDARYSVTSGGLHGTVALSRNAPGSPAKWRLSFMEGRQEGLEPLDHAYDLSP
jgi:hypothetical protein